MTTYEELSLRIQMAQLDAVMGLLLLQAADPDMVKLVRGEIHKLKRKCEEAGLTFD